MFIRNMLENVGILKKSQLKRETMKCEYCEQDVTNIHFVSSNETSHVITYACDACYAELMGTTAQTSSALVLVPNSATTSSATTPSSAPVKPPKFNSCDMCHNVIPEGQTYCKKCGEFMESILWWSENYKQNQKVWSEDHRWYVDVDKLRQYCTAPESWFHQLPGAVVTACGTEKNPSEYTFFDNGSNILFVGHLDKSWGSLDREIFAFFEGDKTQKHYVYNGNLDDRLGVFIGHYLLPTQFGITCDVLLTTDEESGGSTAREFQQDWLKFPEEKRKRYNWIIEFDRHELRPVMYQFEDKLLKERIERYIPTAQGSFSDIACLDQMGCKAINWGTGYHDEHTKRHYAIMEETIEVVEAFLGFHAEFKDIHMPHTYTNVNKNRAFYARWGDDEDYAYASNWTKGICEECHKECYTRYRVADPKDGGTLYVCWTCKENLRKQSKPSVTEYAFECENCGEKTLCVYRPGTQELCDKCLLDSLRPAKKSEEQVVDGEVISIYDGGCENCHKYFEAYYEMQGEQFCSVCYNSLFGG